MHNEILGYSCSVLIGMSLGLLGGGGSLLTLPTLVYILGINPVLSRVYSLFVVGLVSSLGALNYIRNHKVHYRAAALFILPSLITTNLFQRLLTNSVNQKLNPGEHPVSISFWLMMLFSVLVLLAGVLMITNKKLIHPFQFNHSITRSIGLVISGMILGSITSLAGVGGGFLIVPALVLLTGLDMQFAIGTSLTIIGIKSLLGFSYELKDNPVDWPFLILFSGMAMIGILLGSYLSQFIEEVALKKIFGWLILAIGISILLKETIFSTCLLNS